MLALEHKQTAEQALDARNFNAAISEAHLALELIMKSAIYKAGGIPPTSSKKGHDLVEISKTLVSGRKFLHRAINANNTMLPLWLTIYNRWDTSKRYQFLETDPLEMEELIGKYNRLFTWIRIEFVD